LHFVRSKYFAAKSISITSYTITVGSGGAKPTSNTGGNTNGNNSVFDSLTAIGGGRGGVNGSASGKDGGSGGGGSSTKQIVQTGHGFVIGDVVANGFP
jgi:hypothetical protein